MNFGAMSLSENGVFDSRIKFPKDIRTEPRTVEEFEIELYTEDQPGISYLDGKEIPLNRGTLICAKPGMSRFSRLPFKCLYLHLRTEDPHLVRQLCRLPDSCVLTDMTPLTQMFHKLLTLDPNTFPEQRLLLQSYVMELLYRLVREAGTDRVEMLYIHRKTMQQVENYIRENLAKELDLKTLAQQANLSASYFHKLFLKHFGTTPTEYVMQCRISAAKTLLVEGEKSMDQIAEKCGFSSQSYFNYRFKQQTGQTPLQFRRESLSRLTL